MILTKYLKEHAMKDMSVLKKEDFEFIENKVFKDKGKTLKKHVYAPANTVLVFDRGLVIFTIYDTDDTEGFNFDRVALVLLLYKAKNSNLDWDVAYNEFLKCLKLNKCTKMLMYTELDPKFWEKKYKFKLKKYEMELNLKED